MFRRKPKIDDESFARLYQSQGPTELAKMLGINVRNVHARRAQVEERLAIRLISPETRNLDQPYAHERMEIDIKDGVVIVGGDAHYWPGDDSTAHRALVSLTRDLKPKAVIINGDVLDLPSASRHPPIGWENHPTVEDELAAAQEKMGEIEDAAGKARKVWNLGNHDARFNTRLAMVASEYRGVAGTRLVHHFPAWEPAWATFIGGSGGVVVKHRFKGGIHAPHNNALWAGRTIVTGHLHSQKVAPITDYNGTRWGVDTGCLASPRAEQFRNYTEENPLNWRSGFAVLTWKKGRLLTPELVTVHDEEAGIVEFRGELLRV